MTMKDTRKYKQTALGLLPEDWDVAKLGDIGYFLKGNGISKSQANSGNLCAVRYGELYTLHHNYIKTYNSHISKEIALFATKIQRGDILFACSGETKEEIGKCAAFVDEVEAYAGGDILILRTDQEKCSDIFLGFLLNMPTAANQKAAKGQGDAVVHISKAALENLFIPLPPIEEQRRIASALTSIDNLIDSLDRLIAKKRDIKQGAMLQLLSGKKRLKGFTEPWVEKKLGDIGYFLKGSGISKSQANSGTLCAVRYGELYTLHHNYIKTYNSHISKDVAQFATKIQKGDILFACSGETKEEIGKCAAFVDDVEAYAGGDILILRTDQEQCSDIFLGFLLNMPIAANQKAAKGQGDAVVHISKEALSNINSLFPSKEEQQAIASVLTSMDNELSALEAKCRKYEQIKQGMMQQLLTGRISLN